MSNISVPSPALRCADLSAGHLGIPVLRGVDLDLAAGEVLAVLGPSGAGKSTLLHCIAGFSRPISGEIWLGGSLVAGASTFVPPEQRRVGVVFQDNALWPHLDVLATVAYPLRRQGLSAAAARRQALPLLEELGLAGLTARRPHQLSGGEQQRVGLARALARDASLYLLDEPTVHLDLPLRQVAQRLIESGRREARAAAIYTTHEAADALAVADRVAVLASGGVAQAGSPADIYERPVNETVARLTGPASVLRVERSGDRATRLEGQPVAVDGPLSGEDQDLVVRPGWAHLGGPLRGRVVGIRFEGPHTDHELQTGAGLVSVRHPGAPRVGIGEETGWSLARGWLLEPSVGQPAPSTAAGAG